MTDISAGVGDILALDSGIIRQIASEIMRVVPIAEAGGDACNALVGRVDWIGSGRQEYDGMLQETGAGYLSISGCYYNVGNALLDFAGAVDVARQYAEQFQACMVRLGRMPASGTSGYDPGMPLPSSQSDRLPGPADGSYDPNLPPPENAPSSTPGTVLGELDVLTSGGTTVPPGHDDIHDALVDYVNAVQAFKNARQIDGAAAALTAAINAQNAALPQVTVPPVPESADGSMPGAQGNPGNRVTPDALQLAAARVPGLADDVQQDLGIIYPDAAVQLAGSASPPGAFNRNLASLALANSQNTSLDFFDNNCANYVSTMLYVAGMPMGPGWNANTDTKNGNPLPAVLGHPQGHSTPSWYNAQALHDYLMNNGGQNVPVSQAEPGDVIFFESVNPAPGQEPIHHVAIVTGVTPDGQILYSQHTDPLSNASLTQRLNATDQESGLNQVLVVRITPTG